MKIYREDDAIHHEDDEKPLIAMVALGDAVEQLLTDKMNPFQMMLSRARDAFLDAQISLLDADLNTRAGIERARSAQADARRYRDMCKWIVDCFDAREEAEDHLANGEEEPAVEELKDMIHGERRAKPAPDA